MTILASSLSSVIRLGWSTLASPLFCREVGQRAQVVLAVDAGASAMLEPAAQRANGGGDGGGVAEAMAAVAPRMLAPAVPELVPITPTVPLLPAPMVPCH